MHGMRANNFRKQFIINTTQTINAHTNNIEQSVKLLRLQFFYSQFQLFATKFNAITFNNNNNKLKLIIVQRYCNLFLFHPILIILLSFWYTTTNFITTFATSALRHTIYPLLTTYFFIYRSAL